MDRKRDRWGGRHGRSGARRAGAAAGAAVGAWVLAVGVAGCALPEDEGTALSRCEPAETLACGCLDGRAGTAACGPSGLFGPCVCEGAPPAGGADGGTDAGTDAGSDAGTDGGTDAGTDGGTDAGTGDGWPATPQDYVFGPTAYVDALGFPLPDGTTGEATCCRDFDGDDRPDNAWAAFAANLGALAGVYVNADLARAVADGDLVLLWDHRGYVATGGGFLLSLFPGAFAAGTDATTAAAGTGHFHVPAEAFVADSGEPLNWLEGFWDGSGQLDAVGDTVLLRVPLSGGVLPLTLHGAEVYATGTSGAGTAPTYDDGALTGWTPAGEVLASLDAWAASACGCLGGGPLFFDDGGGWQADCSATAAADCSAPGEDLCVLLGGTSEGGGLCESMPALVLGQYPDVDTDTDGTADAWSFGLGWTAVPAEGVTPAAP